MLNDLWTTAQNVLVLFILIAVGVATEKAHILNDNAVKCCANLVLYLATPCVIIKACARPFNRDMLVGFLIMAAAAIGIHLILIAVAHLCFRDPDEGRRRVLRFSTVFSNAGYMGLPLQQAILGDEGVFYCTAYIIVFNIIMWTYGVVDISGNKNELSVKRLLVNPGVIAVTVGLLIFLLQIPLPSMVIDAVGHVASLNTPVPMILVGYYLAQADIPAALRDGRSYLCLALRLVVMPLAFLGILLLCGVHGSVLTSIMICAAAPVAIACTMFATRYDCNPLLSVNLVSASTIFSVVTMPVIIALTNFLGA